MQGQISGERREPSEGLVELWSERDLPHLSTMQRAAREQEMASAYQTFDEEELDTALTIVEHMAPAKVESGGEWTPPTPSDPTEEEKFVLQIRRRLSMREAAKLSDSRAVGQLLDMKAAHSHAVGQLLDMKARVMRATKKNLAMAGCRITPVLVSWT
jgi:hypothetical protein